MPSVVEYTVWFTVEKVGSVVFSSFFLSVLPVFPVFPVLAFESAFDFADTCTVTDYDTSVVVPLASVTSPDKLTV